MKKPSANCKTCKLVKADPRLGDRIIRSAHFIGGGEPLTHIYRDLPAGVVHLQNFYYHVREHAKAGAKVMQVKERRRKTREALQDIVQETDKKAAVVYASATQARKEILQKLMEALDKGDLKLGMNHMVALLGQEQKAEENEKDRSLAMTKMFAYFASGAGAAGKPTLPEKTE